MTRRLRRSRASVSSASVTLNRWLRHLNQIDVGFQGLDPVFDFL